MAEIYFFLLLIIIIFVSLHQLDNIIMVKLNNSIIESLLCVGVTFNIPSDAVIGVLFNILHQEDGDVQLKKLPIADIPYEIRNADINLKNKPTHQIDCKDGFVQIGGKTLCIGVKMPYERWEIFASFICKIYDSLIRQELIKGVSTADLQYLNFYPNNNIFDDINLHIALEKEKINYVSTILKTEIPCDENVVGVLQITNGVHVKNHLLNIDDNGSLIEIHTFTKNVSKENLQNVISNLHKELEKLFNRLTKKSE